MLRGRIAIEEQLCMTHYYEILCAYRTAVCVCVCVCVQTSTHLCTDTKGEMWGLGVYMYVYVCLCVCVCDTSIAVVVYYYNSSVSRVLAWQINNLLMANKLPVQSGKVSQQAMHSIRPDTIVLPCGCQQHRGCALLLPNTELTEI
jgi:hypothetical protein